MIVIFSGSSGAGKNAVMEGLIEVNPSFKLHKKITTRSPRSQEKEKSNYFFVSKEEFEEKIKSGKMLEYELVHGENYYGNELLSVKNALESDDIYLADIDVNGQKAFKKLAQGSQNLVSIFIYVPKKILFERLKNRGDTSDIEKRLSRFDYENSLARNYDYIVKNDKHNKLPIKKVLKIIEKHVKKGRKNYGKNR